MKLIIDFETRSEADIRTVGASVYGEHPSTEILCLAGKFKGGPIGGAEFIYSPFDTERPKCIGLDSLIQIIGNHLEDGGLIEAFNVEFEISIWNNVAVKLGLPEIPLDRWRDTQAAAAAAALPLSLDKCAEAIGLPPDLQKDKRGKFLIQKMSKPRKPTKTNPDKYHFDLNLLEEMCEYCAQDVRCESAIDDYLGELPKKELAVWQADLRMNQRGIMYDKALVAAAKVCCDKVFEVLDKDVQDATNGEITGADLTKRSVLLPWLQSKFCNLEGLAAADVESELKYNTMISEQTKIVLSARAALAKAGVKKYQAIEDRAGADGAIRGTLQYHGASTGRWAGRGIQPQNLPRPTLKEPQIDSAIESVLEHDIPSLSALSDGKPMDAISSCIRGALIPREGHSFVCADYSAIEARVLLWLAGDETGMSIFRRGEDIYCDMASSVFNRPVSKSNFDERQLGKTCILGLGYGMGHAKFGETCATQGVNLAGLDPEEIVKAYRQKYKKIKNLWYKLETLAIEAIQAPGTWTPTAGKNGHRYIRFGYDPIMDRLLCRLPSGRFLTYWGPELKDKETPWGVVKPSITYLTNDSFSRKWGRADTYGGKLVENCTQAAARDLMASAILRVEKAGFVPVLTVHDEILTEYPDQSLTDTTLSEFEDMMSILPRWAKGCPVAAEGWIGKRFRK